MSLVRLILVVVLLLGGTAVTVASYVDSRRPVPHDPAVVDQQPPTLSSGVMDPSRPDPDDEEPDSKTT